MIRGIGWIAASLLFFILSGAVMQILGDYDKRRRARKSRDYFMRADFGEKPPRWQ